jgi:integrase
MTLRNAWEKVARGKVPTKTEATRRAEELERELRDGIHRSDGPMSVAALLDDELRSGGTKGKRARSTEIEIRRVVESLIESLPENVASDVRNVRRKHIEDHLRGLEVSDATRIRRLAYIRRVFERGCEDEGTGLLRNPTKGIRFARKSREVVAEKNEEKVLTLDEVYAILAACRDAYEPKRPTFIGSPDDPDFVLLRTPPAHLFPIVLVAALTGCRSGALCPKSRRDPKTGETFTGDGGGLRWEDIDWLRGRVTFRSKGGVYRPVLPEPARAALRAWNRLQGSPTTGRVFPLAGPPTVALRAAWDRARGVEGGPGRAVALLPAHPRDADAGGRGVVGGDLVPARASGARGGEHHHGWVRPRRCDARRGGGGDDRGGDAARSGGHSGGHIAGHIRERRRLRGLGLLG